VKLIPFPGSVAVLGPRQDAPIASVSESVIHLPHISPADRISVALARLNWDELDLARHLEDYADDRDEFLR